MSGYELGPTAYDRIADPTQLDTFRSSIEALVPFTDVDTVHKVHAAYVFPQIQPAPPERLTIKCKLATGRHQYGDNSEVSSELTGIQMVIYRLGTLAVIQAGQQLQKEQKDALKHFREIGMPTMPHDHAAWWGTAAELVKIEEPEFVQFGAARLLESSPYPTTKVTNYAMNRRFLNGTGIEGSGCGSITTVSSGAVIESSTQCQERLQLWTAEGEYFLYNRTTNDIVVADATVNGEPCAKKLGYSGWLAGITRALEDAVAAGVVGR